MSQFDLELLIKNALSSRPKHRNYHSTDVSLKDLIQPPTKPNKKKNLKLQTHVKRNKIQHLFKKQEYSTNSSLNQKNSIDMNIPSLEMKKLQLHQKEKYLEQWEQRLIKQNYEIQSNQEQLKKFSKALEEKSNSLVRQRLELSEKMQKYCQVLEKINEEKSNNTNPYEQNISIMKGPQPFRTSFHKSPSIHGQLQSSNSVMVKPQPFCHVKTDAINHCQSRIATLLDSIKKASRNSERNAGTRTSVDRCYMRDTSQFEFQPQPQKPQVNELNEFLFGSQPEIKQIMQKKEPVVNKEYYQKQNENVFNQVPPADTICQQVQTNSFIQEKMNTTQSEQDIHELKLKSIQMNEQLFYRKINMEIDKLKELKVRMK